MRRIDAIGLLISFFTLFLFSAASQGEETTTVKIAILPCNDVVKTFERFKLLSEFIENETGLGVQTVFPKDEADLIRVFRKGNVDFIFHSPSGVSKIAELIDPQSVLKALGKDGKDYEIGYLIVRKDSGLKTIQDLKGKTVLLGMECSASRWRAAQQLFSDHGMDIEKDLRSYTDGGCCEDIYLNIFLKAADAGFVCQHYFEEEKKLGEKRFEALTIIGRTSPTPTRIFAAHKDTPRAIIAKFLKALTAIDKNDPKFEHLVKTSEIGGFALATPEEPRN